MCGALFRIRVAVGHEAPVVSKYSAHLHHERNDISKLSRPTVSVV
ncbi:hypothetical protein FHX35_001215 [Auritidibacter ignavus]|nr:hypothetical protein [Auritidibacter ignavus]